MVEQRYVYLNRDGVRKTIIFDDDYPDRFVIQTEQVIDEILAGAERRRELHDPRKDMRGEGYLPVEFYERAVREQWDESDWKRFWNGEGRPFRTSPGSV
jgi:hypothetical protein